ncbi:MAG: delta-60 repeat domain-containing protein [Saprospiraceae bacterium]
MKNLITLLSLFCLTAGWAQPGQLDPTFGNGGIVTTTLDQALESRTIVLQPDGKVVVAGWYKISSRKLLLIRYNTDGSIDTGFGDNGKFISDFVVYDAVNIALLPNGKLVATGNLNGNFDTFFARFNSNGTLDSSFGTGGVIMLDFPEPTKCQAIAPGPGDKLYIAATQSDNNVMWRIAAMRLNADGSFDNSFGTNGISSLDFTSTGWVQDLKVRPDGGMVIGGRSGSSGFLTLAAFTSNGTPDPNFGTNGQVVLNNLPNNLSFFNEMHSVELDGNGNVYGVGRVGLNLSVVKLSAAGVLDASYGENGLSRIILGERTEGFGSAFDAEGKLLVAGKLGPEGNGSRLIVLRLNTDGSLDTNFGTAGITEVSIEPDYTQQASDVVVRPNGKIVAFGESLKPFPIGNLVLIGLTSGMESATHDLAGLVSGATVSPNPVHGAFTLRYQLASPMDLSLQLVDAAGRTIQSFQQGGHQAAGVYERQYQINNTVAGGQYWLVLKAAAGGTMALPVIVAN